MQLIAHLITALLLSSASTYADSQTHYSYNPDGQLTSAQYAIGKLEYFYDSNGNLERQTSTLTFPEGSIQSHKVSKVQIFPDHPIWKKTLNKPHLKIQIQEFPNLTFWINTKSKGSLENSLILENTETQSLQLFGFPQGETLNSNFIQTP